VSVVPKAKMTEEEYLAKERAAEFRSEFYNGEMFAMSGASWNHNRIKSNLEGELYSNLKGGPCQAVSSDQRINVNKSGLYTYPDIAVICEKPEFSKKDSNTLINPQVIIDIIAQHRVL
jgi:Uma2 family endonuclease